MIAPLRVASALLLVLAPFAAAQVGSFPHPFFAEALLDRSALIVRARFVKDEILAFTNVQVTVFEVKETLKGPARRRIMVAGMGERGRAYRELEKLLFLKPLKSRLLHELVDVVDLVPEDAVGRLQTVKAWLAVTEEKSPVKRRDRQLALALRGLSGGSPFAARIAIRELDRLAKAAPQLFDAEDLKQLEAMRARVPGVERARFRALLQRLEERLSQNFRGCEAPFAVGPERELFLRALQRYRSMKREDQRLRLIDELVKTFKGKTRLFLEAVLADQQPGPRGRAAWWLGEFSDPTASGALLRALTASDVAASDVAAVASVIEALGKIGAAEAVPELKPHLQNPATSEAALLALARIGGGEVRGLLELMESRLRADPEKADEAERVAELRAASFQKAEAERRLAARKRWSS